MPGFTGAARHLADANRVANSRQNLYRKAAGHPMPDEPRYVLTVQDGKDTLHKNPREQCNLDDTVKDQVVDEFTAEAMVVNGDAVACRHCNPGF